MPVTVRLASPEFDELKAIVFRRYPRYEWATFARFGWRETPTGLVLTLAGNDTPQPGELNEAVGHVAIQEPYTLRVALGAEKHRLAVGVVHSHPREGIPQPSRVDDDMDRYYADYFQGFAPNRPYVSMILSEVENELAPSGRVFFKGRWLPVDRFVIERHPLRTWVGGARPSPAASTRERTQRLAAAFGDEAAGHLRRSTVAVIGAGGTGSAAIEVLARAGVGHLIVVDPDHLDESNLERVHGSTPADAKDAAPKALIAKRHVKSIDPTSDVRAFVGAIPQSAVVDAIVEADVLLGCTDQQHSRLALSDLAFRYLVPALDCGVMLEGQSGRVTGQIAQIVRFLAADPCALCREMVNPQQLQAELMSEGERRQRRDAAARALLAGRDPNPYWHEQRQLNTVGYQTTAVGALVAGFAIGWLTGRFDPPFERVQANLVAPFLDVTDVHTEANPACACRRARGHADQGAADALITAPSHWPEVRVL